MKAALLTGVLFILCLISESATEIVTGKAIRRTNMDNIISQSRVLWQDDVRATSLCVAKCSNDIRCASTFYSKVTGKCQGHSVTFGVSNGTSNETNSRYFVQPFGETYIGDACITSSDCGTINTECRLGVCACIPGNSFSPRTHECLNNCSSYGDEFMPIHDHYISKSNMETFEPVSVEECFSLCTNRTTYTCVSLEYGWSSTKCFLQNVTVLDVPNKWYEDTNKQFNITYFQRDCY